MSKNWTTIIGVIIAALIMSAVHSCNSQRQARNMAEALHNNARSFQQKVDQSRQ